MYVLIVVVIFFFFFYYSLLLCYYTYYYYYYIGICMTVVRKNRTNEKYKYKPYFYRFWIPSSHRRRLAAVFLLYNCEGSGARRGFHGHNGTAVIVQSGVTIFFFFFCYKHEIFEKRRDRVILVKIIIIIKFNKNWK